MSDGSNTEGQRVPPTASQIEEWQKQDIGKRSGHNKKTQPQEFSRPVITKRGGPGRARKEGTAFEPGRSQLPSGVFGYQPDARNPEDIIISEEERKNRGK